MLSHFVRTDARRRRHLKTLIGPYLDRHLSSCLEQGFARATVRSDLRWATAFGEYLAQAGAKVVSKIDESTLRQFVAHYRTHPRGSGPQRRIAGGSRSLGEAAIGSVRALLAYLREIQAVPPAPSAVPDGPDDTVVEEYLSFLKSYRDFADLTIDQHRRWSTAFFGHLDRDYRSMPLAQLTGRNVESIVLKLVQGIGHRSRQIMTTSIEALIKYLRGAGHAPPTCHPFLPRTRRYTLSSLPSVVPWVEVERVLYAINRSTSIGLRDYTMMLVVATYGLRAGEAVGLQLDHIDWRLGILNVRQTKTRRALELPLLEPVRTALIAYLRDGRPDTNNRAIFIKCHVPRGELFPRTF